MRSMRSQPQMSLRILGLAIVASVGLHARAQSRGVDESPLDPNAIRALGVPGAHFVTIEKYRLQVADSPDSAAAVARWHAAAGTIDAVPSLRSVKASIHEALEFARTRKVDVASPSDVMVAPKASFTVAWGERWTRVEDATSNHPPQFGRVLRLPDAEIEFNPISRGLVVRPPGHGELPDPAFVFAPLRGVMATDSFFSSYAGSRSTGRTSRWVHRTHPTAPQYAFTVREGEKVPRLAASYVPTYKVIAVIEFAAMPDGGGLMWPSEVLRMMIQEGVGATVVRIEIKPLDRGEVDVNKPQLRIPTAKPSVVNALEAPSRRLRSIAGLPDRFRTLIVVDEEEEPAELPLERFDTPAPASPSEPIEAAAAAGTPDAAGTLSKDRSWLWGGLLACLGFFVVSRLRKGTAT